MIVTSHDNGEAVLEDGILDESAGPPPYEVAIRSQAMALTVRDWNANWDRMERGSSGDSDDAGGR